METRHQSVAQAQGDRRLSIRHVGGIALVVAGVTGFLAGALHPSATSSDFHQTITAFLQDARWPATHWLAMVSTLITVVALWVLTDDGWAGASVIGRLGARLTMVASMFMLVEFAVEYAARSAAAMYASGINVAEVQLTEPMQALGWPALNAGTVLLVLGLPALAPLPLRLLAVAGAAAMGLGGVLTMGLHIPAAGPLFIGGAGPGIWFVWVGVRTTFAGQPAHALRTNARDVNAATAHG